MLFNTSDIQRFALQAESRYLAENPCIVDRYSLAITASTAEYTLPDYITNICKITWLGWKIDPISHRNYRDYTVSATSEGKPREYIFNNIGQQKIRFFPVPNQSLSVIQGPGLWGSEIANGVIIEFYRTNDYDHYIPLYISRKLFKPWILNRCYMIDGKGLNRKASAYYQAKWELLKNIYSTSIFEWLNSPRKLINSDSYASLCTIPFARLPIDKFGISVNDEY